MLVLFQNENAAPRSRAIISYEKFTQIHGSEDSPNGAEIEPKLKS